MMRDRLTMLAHGQQNRRVFNRFHAVSTRRDHQEIAGPAVPRRPLCDEPHPALEHLQSRLTRVRMLRHHRARAKSNDRLAKDVFVSTVDGLRARATRRLRRRLHLLAGDGDERKLLHGISLTATATPPTTACGVQLR
jgi:hypothetical protein